LSASLLAVTFVCVLGCGDESGLEANPTQPVTGTVTLNGTPIAKGTILFESADDLAKGLPPGSAEIVDGKYSLNSSVGTKKVKIEAPEATGPKDETGVVPTKETVPAKYNVDTELSANVTEAGPNEFNFDLK